MIEYLNNPALLILSIEVMAFLIVVNVVLLYLLSKKNNKAVKALNLLVKDIKEKGEDNKKKMTEIIMQPGLTDPELIKQGMQNLVDGQTQLYKDVIKAIRTQNVEDVTIIGNSVSDLVNSAMNLGRESGLSSANKQVEEAKAQLESEKQDLQQDKQKLEDKLEHTSTEMNMLMQEYNNMMNNVDPAKSAERKPPVQQAEEPETNEEIIDITADQTQEHLIDVASEIQADLASTEEADEADLSDDLIEEAMSASKKEDGKMEVDIADELMEGLMEDSGESGKGTGSDQDSGQAA